MFNKTIITSPGRTFIDHNTVTHEHRAPTDKSVQLLRDLEREAINKTLSVHRLKNNIIDAVWHIRENHLSDTLTGICQIKINGKEFQLECDLERRFSNDEQIENMTRTILDKIAIEIGKHLFIDRQLLSMIVREPRLSPDAKITKGNVEKMKC